MSGDWAVLGFPALGRFATEGEAIAAAWTVTKPGHSRPAVVPAQTQVSDWNSPGRTGGYFKTCEVSPVRHRVDPSYGGSVGGPKLVREVMVTMHVMAAERIVHGLAPDAAKRALFDFVVKAASDPLYDDADLDEYEDLSISVVTMERREDLALFVAEVEAVVVNTPRLSVR